MIQSFSVKSNDYMYILYIASLIKSVISLHNLINNKIHNKEQEEENLKKEKESEEEKKKLEDAKKDKENRDLEKKNKAAKE
jgi:26S proteasome regulatory subunit N8